MQLFAGITVAIALLVLTAAIVTVVRTRAPSLRPAGSTDIFQTHPDITPLAAGIVLNQPRRAIGAAVLDLVEAGYLEIDTASGPTPYRLQRTREAPLGDAYRHRLMEELFPPHAVQRSHFDPDRRDPEKRARLRGAVFSARFLLMRRGLLHGGAWRRTLEIANVISLVLAGVAFVAGPLAGATVLAIGLATWAVRRRVGWPRTPAGEDLAATLVRFGSTLEHDAAARARSRAWSFFFLGTADPAWEPARESTRVSAEPDPAFAAPAPLTTQEWAADFGEQFDVGEAISGDSGFGDLGGNDVAENTNY